MSIHCISVSEVITTRSSLKVLSGSFSFVCSRSADKVTGVGGCSRS